MATTLLCLEGVTTGRGPAASLRCLGDDDLQERSPTALLQAQAAPVRWKSKCLTTNKITLACIFFHGAATPRLTQILPTSKSP